MAYLSAHWPRKTELRLRKACGRPGQDDHRRSWAHIDVDQIRAVWPTPDESRAGIIWSMNQDGELWEPFYAFSYWQGQPTDRQAAFVYERRPRRRGNSYVPIVSLHLDEKLVCTKASRRWCDVVRSHPPFRKSPGTTWPYYDPTVSGKASNAI